jgi:acyl-CoA-binding protein
MMLMLDQQSEQAKTVVREIKSNPNTKTLELAINSLEHALNGNEDQAKSLLLNLLGSQSPQGKTYGAVISRLLHSPKSNSVN